MLYALSSSTRVNKEIGSEVLKDELFLDGGRNEKLFGYFIFRSKEEEWIKDISFEWSEVKEDCLFSIEFLSARTVKCLKESCSYGMKGDIPEVMLPIEKVFTNAEYCKLQANSNNVFVLSLKTPTVCDAGEYCGKIIFKTNIKEYALNVRVTLFDICLPKANHSRGAFNIWFENDVDANKNLETVHAESYQEYIDCYQLLKSYKVAATEIPVRSKLHNEYCAASSGKIFCFEPFRGVSEQDLHNFIQSAVDATNDEEVPSYILPYSVIKDGDLYAIDKQKLKQLLSLMVDYSTKEIDLFKKAFLHIVAIDEPTQDLFPSVRCIHKDIKETISEVANGKDFSGRENVKVSLLKIENVVTAWPEAGLHGAVDTWCPGVQGWQQADFRSGMKKMSDLGCKTWWYGCICPWYPYSSYHIDEPLLSARIEGFLRWYYDIGGNLYWAVNSDRYRDENNKLQNLDIFNGTERWNKANGDGSLVFSGRYFGVKEYLPSLRLSAMCQGNQDYEYALLFEKKLQTFCKKYGLQINAKEYIRPIFEKAFHAVALSDSGKFFELRREFANGIEALDVGAVFCLGEIDVENQTATVVGYLENGTRVIGATANEMQAFDGYSRVVYKVKLLNNDTYFGVVVKGKEKQIAYKRFLTSSVKKLPIIQFKMHGSIVEHAYEGRRRVYRNLPFANSDSNAPKLILDGQFDFSRLDRFVFDVKSFSEFEFYFSVVIQDKNGKEFKVDYEVVKKGNNHLSLHFNPTMQFNGAKEIQGGSRFSHYDEEIKNLNEIDLTSISKVIIEVHNAKEFCGYFPKEYRHESYEFEITNGYYTSWEKPSDEYNFLKEIKG